MQHSKSTLFSLNRQSLLDIIILRNGLPFLLRHPVIASHLHVHAVSELLVLVDTVRAVLPLHGVALLQQAAVVHHAALVLAQHC